MAKRTRATDEEVKMIEAARRALDDTPVPTPQYIACLNCGLVISADKFSEHISQCNAERKL